MNEFDEKQREVISASLDEKILVNAPPGTGKTYSVAKKIEYIYENKKCSLNDVLVICFSRSAVKEIKNKLKIPEQERNKLTIRTIDSFCSWVIMQIKKEEFKEIFSKTSYDDKIRYTTELLETDEKLKEVIRSLKHIIIDEVQDIVRY